MDESPLGVHEIELVVESLPGGSNGGGVGQAANCPLSLRQISARNNRWGLVVDAHLKQSDKVIEKSLYFAEILRKGENENWGIKKLVNMHFNYHYYTILVIRAANYVLNNSRGF